MGDGLQRLVGGLDRLAVQFEGALCLDQRDEFGHRIDIARFQRVLHQCAGALVAGLPVMGGPEAWVSW